MHLVGLICKIIRFTIKISAPIWLLSLLGYYAVLVGELLPTRWPVGALQVSVIVFATPLRHLVITNEGTAILLNVGTYWQLTLNSWPYKYEGFRILRNVKDYLPLFPKHSQQDASFLDLFIYLFLQNAVHVSVGSCAHNQEHKTVHRVSRIVNRYCCCRGYDGTSLSLKLKT